MLAEKQSILLAGFAVLLKVREMNSSTESTTPSDVHLFVLWKPSGKAEQRWFIQRLASHFTILEAVIIEWDEAVWESSLTRLYNDIPAGPSSKVLEIGNTPFLAVVCRDDRPNYGIYQSLGGEVEASNLNVIDCKREIRQELGENRCHSTSNSEEFLVQGLLLMGVNRLDRLLERTEWDGETRYEYRNLEGSYGWENPDQLFQLLNRTNQWVVLRNFSGLPDKIHEKNDVDVLVEDLERFVAVANARRGRRGFGRYWVRIGGKDIPFDIRCVADGYYDSLWENEILRTRTMVNEHVPVPSREHLFFSLFYHVKVHKNQVDKKYYPVFESLAKEIGFREFSQSDISDDTRAASIISGFMRARKFGISCPLDDRVELNRAFIPKLRAYRLPVGEVLGRRMMLNHLRRMLPLWSYKAVPVRLRRAVKAALDR